VISEIRRVRILNLLNAFDCQPKYNSPTATKTEYLNSYQDGLKASVGSEVTLKHNDTSEEDLRYGTHQIVIVFFSSFATYGTFNDF